MRSRFAVLEVDEATRSDPPLRRCAARIRSLFEVLLEVAMSALKARCVCSGSLSLVAREPKRLLLSCSCAHPCVAAMAPRLSWRFAAAAGGASFSSAADTAVALIAVALHMCAGPRRDATGEGRHIDPIESSKATADCASRKGAMRLRGKPDEDWRAFENARKPEKDRPSHKLYPSWAGPVECAGC